MKTAFFFQLVMNLFFALLLLAGGILLLIFPATKAYYDPLFDLFVTYPWSISLIGITIALVGMSLFSWTCSLLKKGHFETVYGNVKISVDEGLFDKELKAYWQVKFQSDHCHCRTYFRKNKIHIVGELPPLQDKQVQDKQENQQLLREMKQELRDILQQKFGYIGNFTLCLS